MRMPAGAEESVISNQTSAYRGVALALLAGSAIGVVAMVTAGFGSGIQAVLDAAAALGVASAVLFSVSRALHARSAHAALAPAELASSSDEEQHPLPLWIDGPALVLAWVFARLATPRGKTAAWGAFLIYFALRAGAPALPGTPLVDLAAAAIALAGAALAATAARYLANADAEGFAEAPRLARGARVLTWVLLVAAGAALLAWADLRAAARALHLALLTLNVAVCAELFFGGRADAGTDLAVVSALGSRPNPLASVADAAQRQLGIDLRSTWALDVVRRSAEPLLVGLVVVGWLSTALSVVGVEQEGLVERLGVPAVGAPLGPGFHLHWPWPVDRVLRLPVRRVQLVHVGHEGEEGEGPENVLWARQHSANEYTLLLGNGRDLIAIDAVLQFRIMDPRRWRYATQNPLDALRAVAYRAVMKATVSRTLAQVLSENVAELTAQMSRQVQRDADALDLGVEVVGFTVGGMHPPVGVAADYQAVVSAALAKTTAAIDAQAERNALIPRAQADALTGENTARAEGAGALGKASGEAWSFRTLAAEVHTAPEEFRFRRRLESLEEMLAGRRFTVIDARIERDGGELWLTK